MGKIDLLNSIHSFGSFISFVVSTLHKYFLTRINSVHDWNDIAHHSLEKYDFSMVNDLVEVSKKPFEPNQKFNLSVPPKPNEDIKNTFCGT